MFILAHCLTTDARSQTAIPYRFHFISHTSTAPFNWPQFSFRHCVRFRRAHVIDTFTLFRFDFATFTPISPFIPFFSTTDASFTSFTLLVFAISIADSGCVRTLQRQRHRRWRLLFGDGNAIDVIALPKFDENRKWAGKWGTNALFWATYVHSVLKENWIIPPL